MPDGQLAQENRKKALVNLIVVVFSKKRIFLHLYVLITGF